VDDEASQPGNVRELRNVLERAAEIPAISLKTLHIKLKEYGAG
jgi:DNA-binding NtrC family response regulator